MPALLRDRFFIVWAMLVAVTLFSSAIGGLIGPGLVHDARMVTAAVLAIAFAKIWLVMFTFMEVRAAPLALRVLCSAWLAIVLAVLLAIYAGLFN